ncbi:MAG: hypothetical protein AAB785_02815 [Patescibacteria group bacterium]|mgnify:FL=1
MDGANLPNIPKEGPPPEPLQPSEVGVPSEGESIQPEEKEPQKEPESPASLPEFEIVDTPSQSNDVNEPPKSNAGEFTLDNIKGDVNTTDQASRLQRGLSEMVGENQ